MVTSDDLDRIALRARSRNLDWIRETAIHEAGHAVAGLALGFKVHRVDLHWNEVRNGVTFVEPAPGGAGHAGAMVLAAGRMAVALARGGLPMPPDRPNAAWRKARVAEILDLRRETPQDLVACASDREQMGDRTSDEVQRAMYDAGHLLHDRWAAVYAVADALLERGELLEADVVALWQKHAGPVPARRHAPKVVWAPSRPNQLPPVDGAVEAWTDLLPPKGSARAHVVFGPFVPGLIVA
jgi:hypothetical protein